MSGWDAAQRRELQEALRRPDPLTCPACGGRVSRTPVSAPPGVSYVRHRVLLVCASCHRRIAMDLPN